MANKRVFAVLDDAQHPVGAAFCVAADPPLLITCTHTVARALNQTDLPRLGDRVLIRVGDDFVYAHVERNSVGAAPKGDVPRTALSLLEDRARVAAGRRA